jgi:beta-galactosidase
VLLNDTRSAQPYSLSWTATVANKTSHPVTKAAALAVTQNLFVPIKFASPTVAAKTDGVIELTAKIGARSHKDTFAFRVWPRPQKSSGDVTVFDPQGQTTKMLQALGFSSTRMEWQADQRAVDCRSQRTVFGSKPPANLNALVRAGGRVLVMEQDPDWMQHVGASAFHSMWRARFLPLINRIRFMSGLDALDLRDWAGASGQRTLTPTGENKEPVHGWHWSNRGGVTSAAVEKPHLSAGVRFSKAISMALISPLMELDLGRGRATLCTLDLKSASRPYRTLPPILSNQPPIELRAKSCATHNCAASRARLERVFCLAQLRRV